MLVDYLLDIDGLANLDELVDGFILGLDDWEDMAARHWAHANCRMEQGVALGTLLYWCHAIAWLLGVAEYLLPIAR